jgi:hypothetical protein
VPKVDPETGEAMSDAPGTEEGGGRVVGDEDLPEGSNPTGSDAPTQKG